MIHRVRQDLNTLNNDPCSPSFSVKTWFFYASPHQYSLQEKSEQYDALDGQKHTTLHPLSITTRTKTYIQIFTSENQTFSNDIYSLSLFDCFTRTPLLFEKTNITDTFIKTYSQNFENNDENFVHFKGVLISWWFFSLIHCTNEFIVDKKIKTINEHHLVKKSTLSLYGNFGPEAFWLNIPIWVVFNYAGSNRKKKLHCHVRILWRKNCFEFLKASILLNKTHIEHKIQTESFVIFP
jgi:hypothetical protein